MIKFETTVQALERQGLGTEYEDRWGKEDQRGVERSEGVCIILDMAFREG